MVDRSPSRMNKAQFLEEFGGVFEKAPWVLEATHRTRLDRRADSPAGLHKVIMGVLREAGREKLLELIRGEPDLADKMAVDEDLASRSRLDQAKAGIGQCSPEEFALYTRMIAAYRTRFGFPFVMAVDGATKADFTAAMESRLSNDPDTEFAAALREIGKITLTRLEVIMS